MHDPPTTPRDPDEAARGGEAEPRVGSQRAGPASLALPRIASDLQWPLRRRWTSRVHVLGRGGLASLRTFFRLAASAGAYDAVVLDGAPGGAVRLADLGAAAVLARRGMGPAVVVTDATWRRGDGAVDRAVRRAGLAAIDSSRVTYCVLASEERRAFSRSWGVPLERIAFTPFYFTASDEELAAPTSDDVGVFAGGDSLRDYRPLVAAARRLPVSIRLATGALDEAERAELPPHVHCGRVPHREFMEQMRRARIVVVPLADREDRSAGQQTYLNAMALGKLVVVTDVMGVRDHVEHGRTGLVVPPGDAAALERTLRWALDPAHRAECRDIAARAKETVRTRFSPERYVDAVLAVVDDAVARLRRAAGRPAPAGLMARDTP